MAKFYFQEFSFSKWSIWSWSDIDIKSQLTIFQKGFWLYWMSNSIPNRFFSHHLIISATIIQFIEYQSIGSAFAIFDIHHWLKRILAETCKMSQSKYHSDYFPKLIPSLLGNVKNFQIRENLQKASYFHVLNSKLLILMAYKVQEGGLLKSHQSLTSSNFKNFDIWLKLSRADLPSQIQSVLPTLLIQLQRFDVLLQYVNTYFKSRFWFS